MKKLICFVAISLIVVACNPQKAVVSSKEDVKTEAETTETATDMLGDLNEPENADSLFVIIKRSSCFGTCPYYEMTIYNSGYVVLNGKQHVEPLGMNSTTISEKKINSIKQSAYDIDFFSLNNEYDNKGVTDLPANTITIQVDGKSHTVMNRFGGPTNFRDLVDMIHSVIEESEWTAVK